MIGSGLLIHCINAPLRQSKRIEGCTKHQPLSYKNSTSIVSQTASSAPLPCLALAFRYSHFRVSAQWSRALQHSEITQAEIDYLQQPNGLKSRQWCLTASRLYLISMERCGGHDLRLAGAPYARSLGHAYAADVRLKEKLSKASRSSFVQIPASAGTFHHQFAGMRVLYK